MKRNKISSLVILMKKDESLRSFQCWRLIHTLHHYPLNNKGIDTIINYHELKTSRVPITEILFSHRFTEYINHKLITCKKGSSYDPYIPKTCERNNFPP